MLQKKNQLVLAETEMVSPSSTCLYYLHLSCNLLVAKFSQFCCSSGGVNGTDNIHRYLSSDSFRGVNIRPYPSPDIQYPTPYPNQFLWYRYIFISYLTNLILSIPDPNPRRKITICVVFVTILSYSIHLHPYVIVTIEKV